MGTITPTLHSITRYKQNYVIDDSNQDNQYFVGQQADRSRIMRLRFCISSPVMMEKLDMRVDFTRSEEGARLNYFYYVDTNGDNVPPYAENSSHSGTQVYFSGTSVSFTINQTFQANTTYYIWLYTIQQFVPNYWYAMYFSTIASNGVWNNPPVPPTVSLTGTVPTFKFYYMPEGGTGVPQYKELDYGQAAGDLPVPSRTGYDFVGWFLDNGVQVTSSTICQGDALLWARWSPKTYRVYFNYNGGSGGEASIAVTYDSTYGAAGNWPWPSRTGYSFSNWWTSDGTYIGPETQVKITSDIWLNAAWSANWYTVYFNPNGGTNLSFSSKSVQYDSTYGNLPTVSRVGYSFAGWFYGGFQYHTSTVVRITAEFTLYAEWTPNKHIITFNPNGGQGEIFTRETIYDTGNWNAIGANTTRVGYDLVGWFNSPSGGTKIYNADGTVVNDGTYWVGNVSKYDADYTLYAQWSPHKHTITFMPNGGQQDQFSFETIYDTSNYYSIGADRVTRTGFDLTGWFTASEGGTKVYGSDGVVVNDGTYWVNNVSKYDGSYTLYAQWEISKYDITVKGKMVGYKVTSSYPNPVLYGGSYQFGVLIDLTYKKGKNFKVLCNGVELTPFNDVYTIEEVYEDKEIEVLGVEPNGFIYIWSPEENRFVPFVIGILSDNGSAGEWQIHQPFVWDGVWVLHT